MRDNTSLLVWGMPVVVFESKKAGHFGQLCDFGLNPIPDKTS
jgi:hypothetical protein